MSTDILLKIEMLLTAEELFDKEDIEKFINIIKYYSKGKWIYPDVFKRNLSKTTIEIYQALNLLKNNNIIESYHEVHCPNCAKTNGELYETIPEEYECEYCQTRFEAKEYSIVIYKVIEDGY